MVLSSVLPYRIDIRDVCDIIVVNFDLPTSNQILQLVDGNQLNAQILAAEENSPIPAILSTIFMILIPLVIALLAFKLFRLGIDCIHRNAYQPAKKRQK